ncbi:hypothetical protein OPV22_011966 [Ensete ventricosum]|uniref:Uncharacterized protein n=1 Tax=Ensete ventricosum TaxID=4639 RepID=A0AAV8QW07_ENSVE|nr:hypothetical protein OPV22_034800 [Ensete ventricosum]KAJ8490245.1 hypothetical protein OPV22_011966 [Ensete ventricosum]
MVRRRLSIGSLMVYPFPDNYLLTAPYFVSLPARHTLRLSPSLPLPLRGSHPIRFRGNSNLSLVAPIGPVSGFIPPPSKSRFLRVFDILGFWA